MNTRPLTLILDILWCFVATVEKQKAAFDISETQSNNNDNVGILLFTVIVFLTILNLFARFNRATKSTIRLWPWHSVSNES